MSQTKKCNGMIRDTTGWGRGYQCSRNATEDGYCATHHPEKSRARQAKLDTQRQQKERAAATRRAERIEAEHRAWLKKRLIAADIGDMEDLYQRLAEEPW